jgi:hypothetical protein
MARHAPQARSPPARLIGQQQLQQPNPIAINQMIDSMNNTTQATAEDVELCPACGAEYLPHPLALECDACATEVAGNEHPLTAF